MATLWIKEESNAYTQIAFSTGYTFGFYGLHSTDWIKVIGGGRIEEGKKYLIKKVKISNNPGTGFWWLGEPRDAYFDSFSDLIGDIAPGCLTKRCAVLQLIIEEV